MLEISTGLEEISTGILEILTGMLEILTKMLEILNLGGFRPKFRGFRTISIGRGILNKDYHTKSLRIVTEIEISNKPWRLLLILLKFLVHPLNSYNLLVLEVWGSIALSKYSTSSEGGNLRCRISMTKGKST